MRSIFIVTIFCVCNISLQAQNLFDKNWVFGDSIGITFTPSGIKPIKSSLYCFEADASISDANGNLLFYSDGCSLWDKNGNIMQNGSSLFCGGSIGFTHSNTATNGVLILPKPSSNSIYYVITLCFYDAVPGLYYNVVDMNGNGGLGTVTSKNQPLIASMDSILTEKLTAVKHGNGRDWWIYVHQDSTDEFIRFLLTPSGFQGPFYQHIGTVYKFAEEFLGEMCISDNGKMLATVGFGEMVNVFKIDRCSGLLYNFRNLNSHGFPIHRSETDFYGACFSPSGNKLYISNMTRGIKQYSIDTSSNVGIADTGKYIWENSFFPENGGINIGQLELGPDKKIYQIHCYNSPIDTSFNDSINKTLGIVNFPELAYPACNFQIYGAYLNAKIGYNTTGLPNFANLRLGPLSGSGCDSISVSDGGNNLSINDFQIYPNPANDYLNIAVKSFSSPTLTNLLGNEMYIETSCNVYQESKQIDVSSYPDGIYFLQVRVGNQIINKKFVVAH